MKTVYKYKLDYMNAVDVIEMPIGAEILHIEEQRGDVCLWATVDKEEQRVKKREFLFYGTGSPIDDSRLNHEYIGTVLLMGGSLVLHFFEVTK